MEVHQTGSDPASPVRNQGNEGKPQRTQSAKKERGKDAREKMMAASPPSSR